MKITKSQLKQIIKEEIEEAYDPDSGEWASRLGIKIAPEATEPEPEHRAARDTLLAIRGKVQVDIESLSEDAAEKILNEILNEAIEILHHASFGEPAPSDMFDLDEKIKKVKGGYKAASSSGRELSKKPKTKKQHKHSYRQSKFQKQREVKNDGTNKSIY